MGSINDEIQRVLNPIYGDKSTNHLMRLFRTDHGLLEENLWHNFLQNLDYTGSINDQLYYLFSNFESIFNASTGLYLSNVGGNFVSTPDHSDLDFAGSFCLVIDLRFAVEANNTSLMGKWADTGNQRGILFRISAKTPQLYLSTTGADFPLLTSSSPYSAALNQRFLLSVTWQVTTGTTRFWEKLEDQSGWTLLSSGIHGAKSLFNNNTSFNIVPQDNGVFNTPTGTIYSAQIYDGIGDNSAPGLGTLVAEFDASAPVGPRYRDRTGKIWTINGSAWSWV